MLDELYYYDIAKNLFNGNGISVRMSGYHFQKILYSILILPAFSIESVVDRMKVIGWINSFIISLGTFPAYGIARKIFDDNKRVWLSMLLWIALPIKVFGMGFMSEVASVPLSMLFIYLYILLLDVKDIKKCVCVSALLAFVQYLLYFNKEITLYVFIAFVISALIRVYMDKEHRKLSLTSLIVYAAVFLGTHILIKAFVFTGMDNSYQHAITKLTKISFGDIFLSAYHFVWLFAFAIVGAALLLFSVVPVLIKKLDYKEKEFVVFLVLSMIVCMGAVACFISRTENTAYIQARCHLRYIEPFVFVYYIYPVRLIDKYYDIISEKWKNVATTATLILSIFVGLGFSLWSSDSSFPDTTSMYIYTWMFEMISELNQGFLLLLACRIAIALVCGGLLYVIYKKGRAYFTYYFAFLTVVSLFSYTVKYIRDYPRYYSDAEYIECYEDTENMIKDLGGTAVFISHTKQSYVQKYFDSWFDEDITLMDTRAYYLDGFLEDGVIDIEKEGLWDTVIDNRRIDRVDHVDYIIAAPNVKLDNVEPIEDFPMAEEGYCLYRNLDPKKIYVECSLIDAVTDEEMQMINYIEQAGTEYIQNNQ